MSRIYVSLAIVFFLIGLAAAVFAPLGGMSETEAFYARLILIGPATLIGTLISALGVMIGKLDRLIAVQQSAGPRAAVSSSPVINDDEPLLPFTTAPQVEPSHPQSAPSLRETSVPAPEPFEFEISEHDIAERRALTVEDYLGQERRKEEQDNLSPLAREGTFAGRSYRMYEDGSLEIDTDQSTIRFDSLDEFRTFVSSVAKKDD